MAMPFLYLSVIEIQMGANSTRQGHHEEPYASPLPEKILFIFSKTIIKSCG